MKRKLDAVLQTSVDRRDLATIAEYFRRKGIISLNRSTVVRLAIETLAKIIVKNGGIEFAKTEDAQSVLEELGIDQLNPSRRLVANYLANLEMDSSEDDQDGDDELPKPLPVSKQVESQNPDRYATISKLVNEAYKNNKQKNEEVKC
jgi:hypothetical protein